MTYGYRADGISHERLIAMDAPLAKWEVTLKSLTGGAQKLVVVHGRNEAEAKHAAQENLGDLNAGKYQVASVRRFTD